MIKFAICNELFRGWDFKKVVNFVAKTGYQGLEIAPFTLADSVKEISPNRRRELKDIAADAGISITGLHWLLVKPEGLHISHPDPKIRERTVDYLRQLIDFAADIGGQILVFGSPNQRNILPELNPEQAWELASESLRACLISAGSSEVKLCLEALPGNLTNFLNTNTEVLRMVRQINHPQLRMMLDVKSMCAETLPINENIISCQGLFEYVHANDSNLKGPGFGTVDFQPIFNTLKQVGYDGYVSVEVFDFEPDPETIAQQSLAYMKSCLGKDLF